MPETGNSETKMAFAPGGISPETEAEEVRRKNEKEMKHDYNDQGELQGRDIDHLILVTHGIGQRLGMRYV
jgi:hypothetical protein